jgi:hypothetical protein
MADDGGFEARRSARLAVEIVVLVDHPRSSRLLAAELSDLSREGCRIITPEPFEPGAQILIKMPDVEPWPARVIWAREGAVGTEFHDPLPAEVVAEHGLRFQQGGD